MCTCQRSQDTYNDMEQAPRIGKYFRFTLKIGPLIMIETKNMLAKKPRHGRIGDHAASVLGNEAFKIPVA